MYVQYGCGLSSPEGWLNFDASPTLRLQRIPLLGSIFRKVSSVKFPVSVLYGDIIKGLPGVQNNSCKGVYCSHILEHLSLEDVRIALNNSHKIMASGGIFRLVLPDLSIYARNYINAFDKKDPNASIEFMKVSMLGVEKRQRGIKGILDYLLSNKHHLWMWDSVSMTNELKAAGFREVRTCMFNDSNDDMFKLVESEGRFNEAIALEAIK